MITTAIIRGSHPISGHGKIHSVMEEADLIISERLPPWSRLLLPTTPHTHTHTHTLTHTHTHNPCQNVEAGIWLETEWGKHANF